MTDLCTKCGNYYPQQWEGLCGWCRPADSWPTKRRRRSNDDTIMQEQHDYYDAIVYEGLQGGRRSL